MEELSLRDKLMLEFLKINSVNITHQQIGFAIDLAEALTDQFIERIESKKKED